LLNADRENGRTIYSSLDIDENFLPFSVDTLVDLIEKDGRGLLDCSILLHGTDMSSRYSATKVNKLLSYFMIQTRRRSVDLYIIAHSIDLLDKRIRRNIEVLLHIDGPVAGGVHCTVFERRTGRKRRMIINENALGRGSLLTEEEFVMNMEAMLSDYVLEMSCLV